MTDGGLICASPIVQVRDPRRTAAWLEAAFGFDQAWIAEDGSYAVCRSGSAEIHLGVNDNPAILKVTAENMEVLIRTRDLAAAYQRFLMAESFGASPPEVRPWGVEEFHCYGPDHELYRVAGPASS